MHIPSRSGKERCYQIMNYREVLDDMADNTPLDETEFKRVFQSSFVSLCTFCQLKYGFDLDLAKDVIHVSFVKLWQSRHRVHMHSVKAYLFKIIQNASLDILKDQQQRRIHSLVSQSTSQEAYYDYNSAEVKELSAAVRNAVSQLPDQMRTVFELSRYEGLKYSEIADRLNLSLKTVETHMSRALAKLKQMLAGHLPIILTITLTEMIRP